MVGKDDVRGAGDKETPFHRNALLEERFPLGAERFRVDDDAVSDVADGARAKNSGRDEVEHELPLAHADRVARVGTALIARDDVGLLAQQVDDLSFALIAPLGAHDDTAGHDFDPLNKKTASGAASRFTVPAKPI